MRGSRQPFCPDCLKRGRKIAKEDGGGWCYCRLHWSLRQKVRAKKFASSVEEEVYRRQEELAIDEFFSKKPGDTISPGLLQEAMVKFKQAYVEDYMEKVYERWGPPNA